MFSWVPRVRKPGCLGHTRVCTRVHPQSIYPEYPPEQYCSVPWDSTADLTVALYTYRPALQPPSCLRAGYSLLLYPLPRPSSFSSSPFAPLRRAWKSRSVIIYPTKLVASVGLADVGGARGSQRPGGILLQLFPFATTATATTAPATDGRGGRAQQPRLQQLVPPPLLLPEQQREERPLGVLGDRNP